MKNFFKFLFASMLGFILAIVIVVLIFAGIIAATVSSFTKQTDVEIEEKTVLKIELDQPIPDRTSDNPFEAFNFDPYDMERIIGLNDILKTLEKAETDDNVEGVFLNLSYVASGMASLEEIRNALINFKKDSDKWIICYADYLSQKAYYLATVADEIYINPEGMLDLRGMSAQIWFYKNTLEKLGLEPQIFRHGKFKSAIEPLINEKMSEANREQTLTYTQSLWDHMVSGIANARKMNEEDLNMYADELMIDNAESAFRLKLIDGLKYKDEILAEINNKLGNDEDDDIEFMKLAKYKNVPIEIKKKELPKDKIAVVFAEGEIVMGKGDDSNIGGERLAKTIRKAREKDNVKAVVLRVNSPGGNGLASEIIWREVQLTKEVKPVVVSMGNLAASGGYYISCPADFIFAQPNTLTGSIGVFGVFLTGKEMLNEKLGITTDHVETNAHADMGNFARPMDSAEVRYLQKNVEGFYDTFIGHVAEGRQMTKAAVDSIGQGRVWSGINALEINLVDSIGGLDNAVEKAASLAGIDAYRIYEMPRSKDFMQQLLSEFSTGIRMHVLNSIPWLDARNVQKLQSISQMEDGIYARMMYDVEVQ